MKNKATKFATIGAVAVLLATSAFAAPQQSENGRWDQPAQTYNRESRHNGYRGQAAESDRDNRLDRGGEYFIPEARRGGRGLRYNNGGYLQGVVERIDYRDGRATLRDDASGRFVAVNLGGNVRQIRRGDSVTLEGHWDRGNIFDAYQIDNVR